MLQMLSTIKVFSVCTAKAMAFETSVHLREDVFASRAWRIALSQDI